MALSYDEIGCTGAPPVDAMVASAMPRVGCYW
jgi:hypothetical protein